MSNFSTTTFLEDHYEQHLDEGMSHEQAELAAQEDLYEYADLVGTLEAEPDDNE